MAAAMRISPADEYITDNTRVAVMQHTANQGPQSKMRVL